MDDETSLGRVIHEIEMRYAAALPVATSVLSTDPAARIRAALAAARVESHDHEFKVTLAGAIEWFWGALCNRYGISLYRTSARTKAVCIQAPPRFVREVLWPVFEEAVRHLERHFFEVTKRITSGVFDDAHRR